MQIGSWQLDTLSGGRFWLDGGTMFGVVPKALWQKVVEVDERNRFELGTNCVLLRDERHTLLIDTGYGGKASPAEQRQMSLEPGEPLVESLDGVGIVPDQIDLVVFSHLHFDHTGGGTRAGADGAITPTFPRATHCAGRLEWEDALSGAAELRGAYPPEHLLPLEQADKVRLLDDGEEVVPGLTVQVTGGHTRGHLAIVLEADGGRAVYLGDLCPTHWHMRTMWCMAYDTHPLETRRRKPELLGQAADENWLILWDHDPQMAACRIARDAKREFVVTERYERL